MEASSETPTHERERLRVWVLLALILAAALGVRLLSLSHESAWYDEIMLLQPLDSPNVVEYLRNALPRTPVPPLFMITEYFWSRLVGLDVTALRLWPVICGVAGLAALFMLTRRLFNAKTALIATLWASFMFWHIHYSQELRYYPLSSLFVVLSAWSFVELAAAPKPRMLAMHGIINACMVWTHPLTAFLCVAQTIFLLLYRRSQPRTVATWFAIHALLALSLVAFVASLNQQAASAQAAWIPRPVLWGGSPSVCSLLSLGAGIGPVEPVNRVGEALVPAKPWFAAALIIFHIVAVVLGARAILRGTNSQMPESNALGPKETVVFLLLWLAVPPAVAFGLSYAWRPIFVERYVLFATVPAYMLIAYFLSRLPRAATASAVACLLAYDGLFYFPGPTRTRFDRAAATIAAESMKAPELYVDDMLVAPALGFYWKGPQPTFHSLLDFDKAESAASAGAEVWFVYTDRDRFERRVKRLHHENVPIATEEFLAGYRLWTIHLYPNGNRQ